MAPAIFTRPARPSDWNPAACAGPYPWLTLREWQVSVALFPLSRALRGKLAPWLTAPTDLTRWPRSAASFQRVRLPLLPDSLARKSEAELYEVLGKELAALRYLLDMPPQCLSGLVRNGLLAAHGRRLRQLEDRLGTTDTSVALGLLMMQGNLSAGAA